MHPGSLLAGVRRGESQCLGPITRQTQEAAKEESGQHHGANRKAMKQYQCATVAPLGSFKPASGQMPRFSDAETERASRLGTCLCAESH